MIFDISYAFLLCIVPFSSTLAMNVGLSILFSNIVAFVSHLGSYGCESLFTPAIRVNCEYIGSPESGVITEIREVTLICSVSWN